MIPLAALITAREEGPASGLDRLLMPIGMALTALPEVVIQRTDLPRVMRGQPVLLRGAGVPAAADPVHATYGGRSLAIGAIERGEFLPKRVFKS